MGGATMQHSKGAVTELELVQLLRDQGWRVAHENRKFTAYPPDKSRRPIFFTRISDPQVYQNIITELRRAGFVWHERDLREMAEAVADLLAPPGTVAVDQAAVPRALPRHFGASLAQYGLDPAAIAPPQVVRPEPEPSTGETFGQSLQRVRLLSESDRATLADLVGVTESAVEKWENDVNNPTMDHYSKLLSCFPELALVPAPPDLRDMAKPGRVTGSLRLIDDVPLEPFKASAFCEVVDAPPEDVPPVAEPLPWLPPPNLPLPDPALTKETDMSQPSNQKPVLVPRPSEFMVPLRFIKLAVVAKGDEAENVLALLREARDAGLNISDVLEMLE